MYAKVFSQIFDSSIADDYELRHFFMDLLVLADSDGIVDMTASAISARTRMPLEKVLSLLQRLELPDDQSRTPDADGRRIQRLDEHRDWGWLIINYDRFRAIGNDMERKQQVKARVARYRSKMRNINDVTLCNADVTGASPSASASVQGKGGVGEGGISASERISKEKELGRIDRRLGQLAKPKDYAKGSPLRKETEDLINRRKTLTTELGVMI